MKSFLLVLLIFSTFFHQAFAQKLLPSVEWQKTALKEQIETKISDVLMRVLKPNEFFVNARIDLGIPQMPDFNKPKNADAGKAAENTRINKVKSSNAPENDPYGYIVFHKMGLEAPLIEDFKTNTSVASGASEEVNDFENIWKYNKAIDIYNNLDHIVISIKVTNKVKEKDRPKLEAIIKDVGLDIPGIQPDIKIDYLDFHLEKMAEKLTADGVVTSPPTMLESALNNLEKFQYPLTIMIAVFTLGFFGLMLMKKYKEILEGVGPAATTMTMENAAGGNQDENEEKAIQDEISPVAIGQSEIDRFKAYLDLAPLECAAMARSWIREGDTVQALALSALAVELPNDKLSSMASHLSEEDKAKMRTLIIYNLKPTELAQAKTYIGSQVRDEIIKGEKIDDPELQQMLLSLSPKNAAKMMTEYPPAIYVLFSKLMPKFLSMIIEELDEAKRAMILSEAITQKPVDAEDMQAFKTKLTKYSEVELYSPALEKIKLMLPSSTLSTEESLYNVMAMHGNAQSIKTCALKHIPYQLISSMPEELLKESLLSYDSVKRIEYLETIAGDEKDFLLNAFAPAGSKARDIYEMDYERVLADTTAVDKINTNQDAISKHFIFHLRELIRKSPQYQSKIESAVITWAENLMAQKVSKTKLKVAV